MNAYDITPDVPPRPNPAQTAAGGVVDFALPGHNFPVVPSGTEASASAPTVASPYLTSDEAAAYLRKSVSWLLRVRDMAFLRGKPNLYAKADLDAWVERHKHRPRVKV